MPSRLSSTGTPLGLLPPGLPYGESHRSLAPGDTLVLFSDGVTEAQNAADEEFGEARLLDVLRAAGGQPADVIVDRVMTAIDAFAGRGPAVRRHHAAGRPARLTDPPGAPALKWE